MIDFAKIKSRVSMRDVAVRYGIDIHRGNVAMCPFHREKTPSMKLYKDGFYCFGCGAGGDVINFVARLFGLTNKEAAEKLDSDFSTGATSALRDPAADARWREAQREKKLDAAERADLLRQICAKRRCLYVNRFDQTGKNQADCHYLDYVVDNYDEFPTKEVREIARRIPRVT
ncbi:MAG: hypothetical protein IJF49_08335 [Clostridia bacterium]|nr:hypothetical protein [Clostridia bacterium]